MFCDEFYECSRMKCHLHRNQAQQNHFKMTPWRYVIFNQLHTDPLLSHQYNMVVVSKPFCTSLIQKKTRKWLVSLLRIPREFTAPIVPMGTRNRAGENSSDTGRNYPTPLHHLISIQFLSSFLNDCNSLTPITLVDQSRCRAQKGPKGLLR